MTWPWQNETAAPAGTGGGGEIIGDGIGKPSVKEYSPSWPWRQATTRAGLCALIVRALWRAAR